MNQTGIAFAPPPVLSPIPTEYEEPHDNILTKSFANQSEKSNALQGMAAKYESNVASQRSHVCERHAH